ncbi:phage tail tape measure protein [Blautia producta]|uniref:Phage tail tape measure protein n=5 Tax=Blautia producta TaxID=33035 RepID=A0A7G5N371_9FIRM|nr:phage tail tape measure protein [Blautia producta ATCC 27340 = DSM 2950]QIB58806.1 phage tail tape measure protein [Blautia producta ATCC 27340 = DSM 2950]QMW81314.1 phage tail tape measure protein [Blautia producta]
MSDIKKAFSTAQTSLDTLEKKFESASQKFEAASKKFAPISAAVAGVGAASGKMALDFEDSMANVNTLLDDPSHLEGYKNAVRRISDNTGLSLETMSAGMYQAISSLGDGGEETERIFTTMARSAKAGGAEVSDSVALISAGMKGYNDVSNETAQKISDLAFQTAKLGVTTFPEMAKSMQPLFPLANSLNLSYEELFGSMATLTGVTGNTAEVSTQLKAVFSNLMAPTTAMQGVIEKYGYSSGQAMLESEGLAGMLKIVQNETGGQADKMAELFSSTEAVTAMTALTGSQFDTFNDKLGQMSDAAGATNAAYEKLQTNGDKLRKAWNQVKNMGVLLGSTMIDMMVPAIMMITDKIDTFSEYFANADDSTKRFIVTVGAIVAAIAPALMLTGKLAGIGAALAKGFAMVSSPAGIVIALVAGLAAGFAHLMVTNEEFREHVIGIWQGIQAIIEPIISSIKEKCATLFSGISDGSALDGIEGKFSGVVSKIQPAVETIKGMVSSAVEFIKPMLPGIFDGFMQSVSNFVPALQSIFGTAKNIIGTIAEAFSGFFSGLTSGFKGGLTGAGGFQTGFMAILGLISPPLKMIILLFQNFGPQIQALAAIIGSSLVPVFTTLGTTIGGIASAILPAIQSAVANLMPVFVQIVNTVLQVTTTVLPVLVSLFNQLAPFLVQIAEIIGQLAAAIAPMIAQLVGSLLPVITNIITVVANIVTSLMPAAIAIINVIMSVIQTLVPIITNILSVVISVISGIISAISPVVSFIGTVIAAIMGVISPIVAFIADIIATIVQVVGTVIGAVTGVFSTVFSVVSGTWSSICDFTSKAFNTVGSIISVLTGVVGKVFNGIYSVVSSVMGNVREFIAGVFNGIQTAWNGLTSFVSGIFDGVSSAVADLVSTVKGFVNDVIGGINWALDVINMIPGVSIGYIPYLLHGTDDWSGGFARMNEGGRGELTYLPDGSKVIPHDVSMKYAKESARENRTGSGNIDLTGVLEGVTIQVINNTNVDGTPLRETMADYTIRKIGERQRGVRKARGA